MAAALAALVVATPAEASRGDHPTTTTTTQPGYVPAPQYGQNPHPELPDEPNPYANPVVAPTVVPVDLPADTNPGAGLAGEGDRLGPAPSDGGAVEGDSGTRPESPSAGGGFVGGLLSRTGAETLPMARAGLAVLTLGLGLVVLARRRRVDSAAA